MKMVMMSLKEIVASLFLFSKCFLSFAKCSPVQKVSSLYFIRTASLCLKGDDDDDYGGDNDGDDDDDNY